MEPSSWVCPFFPNLIIFWLVTSLLVVWSMVWKGIALWRAGRNSHLIWFIALFIVNTLGILEMIYIFAVAPKRAELGQEATTGPAG